MTLMDWFNQNLGTIAVWIAIAQGCVTIPVLLAGTYIAWIGLSTWRAQITAKAEYDLARRVLLRLYRIRDAIQAARFEDDWASDVEESKLRPVQAGLIQEVAEAERSLRADLLEATVLWDRSTTLHFDLVRFSASELEGAYRGYYLPDLTEAERAKYRAVLFETPDADEDEFGESLRKHIEAAIDILRPKLTLGREKPRRRGSGWMSIANRTKHR
jgi:hypothetical protein